MMNEKCAECNHPKGRHNLMPIDVTTENPRQSVSIYNHSGRCLVDFCGCLEWEKSEGE